MLTAVPATILVDMAAGFISRVALASHFSLGGRVLPVGKLLEPPLVGVAVAEDDVDDVVGVESAVGTTTNIIVCL